MKKLTQKELNIIENICGSEYTKRIRAIQEKQKDNTVRIVNTGMVSSGKSSLYNVLINSQDEFFPTGAARTTTKANYFDYKNISYIDTPGIDVRSEDDAVAFNTIIKSDVILMIHNVRTGPLNRSEEEWLKRLAERMSSIEACKSRLVFVISWKDTREKEEDYKDFVLNLKKKVFKIVRTEIPFFEVSVKKYQQGKEKEKDILIKNSGVLELKDYLEKYASEYIEKKKAIDREDYEVVMNQAKKALLSSRDSKMNETQKIYERIRNNQKSKKSAWTQIYNYFATQRNRLTNLENEMRNI